MVTSARVQSSTVSNMADDERTELLNSMLKRGPNKRRIKPAENNELLALALGVEEESEEDDEDFEVNSDDDEESFSESGDEGNVVQKTAAVSHSGTTHSEDDSSDDDSGSDEEVTVEEVLKKAVAAKNSTTRQKSTENSKRNGKSSASLNLLICGICLGDSSDEDDEIIECDSCGICVHESCYGLASDNDSDAASTDSSDTDSSTEPWFCDACKSGITPKCELCPNLGGIFKETLRGQWVHLVCALYTPGVTFDAPEKLENVVLIDLHPSKWGSKECNLCEDVNLSRTGVCIGCDAGMCKTFFHATCAQKKGLLSELPEEDDEDVADPLYAHCKLHLDKSVAKKKSQAYLTYISHVKKFEQTTVDNDRQQRISESLQVAREVYRERKTVRNPLPPLKEKVARSLLSSPLVLRHLLRKAELLGYVSQQSKLTNTYGNTRRKGHIPVSLTVEFVNHFYDRSNRVETMKKRLQELTTSNKDLQQGEQELRTKYEELSSKAKTVTSKYETTKKKCFLPHNTICRLAEKDFSLPDTLKKLKRKNKKSTTQADSLRLNVCSKCEKTDNQHLQVQCDTCRSHYHLACVDPPLARMPKKGKNMLWQCTECDSSSDEDDDEKAGGNDSTLLESRQKRNVKEPSKFTPGRDPNRKRKRKKQMSSSTAPKPEKRPYVRKRRPTAYVKKEKVIDVRKSCSTCGKAGDNTNLVRCDECKKCFHFGCLDPPKKSNPKPKGYSWYCTECDDTPDEDSDEKQNEEEPADKSNVGETSVKMTTPDKVEKNETQGNENIAEESVAVEEEKVTEMEVTDNQKE